MRKVFYVVNGIETTSFEEKKELEKKFGCNAKETVFGNDLIPYVRYHRNGRLIADSNFVFRDDFLAFFRKPND